MFGSGLKFVVEVDVDKPLLWDIIGALNDSYKFLFMIFVFEIKKAKKTSS